MLVENVSPNFFGFIPKFMAEGNPVPGGKGFGKKGGKKGRRGGAGGSMLGMGFQTRNTKTSDNAGLVLIDEKINKLKVFKEVPTDDQFLVPGIQNQAYSMEDLQVGRIRVYSMEDLQVDLKNGEHVLVDGGSDTISADRSPRSR